MSASETFDEGSQSEQVRPSRLPISNVEGESDVSIAAVVYSLNLA